MKRIALFLLPVFYSVSAVAQPARYVILISIDAMRPEFYKDPSWPAPNLQQMMKEGVYADKVRPVFYTCRIPMILLRFRR